MFRKHAFNQSRLKPAFFQVLCEIKEKTGGIILQYLAMKLFNPQEGKTSIFHPGYPSASRENVDKSHDIPGWE